MIEQEAMIRLDFIRCALLGGTKPEIIPNDDNVELMDIAIKALEEVQQYRAIGTVEELQKAEKEESILKFYYCDSEDSYLVGLRIGNFYYAHYIDGRWIFDMSRYLPWGKHVVDDTTAWKEYTYPSEPREISFSEWLNGFIKKECGGTVEECRAAVEKQKEIRNKAIDDFEEKLLENAPKNYAGTLELGGMSCYLSDNKVKQIAEKLKGGGVNE